MNEKKEKLVRKCVTDLGLAAYLCLFGPFDFCGKKGRNIYFDIKNEEVSNFDRLFREYWKSSYLSFDNHLMSIKKFGDVAPPEIE